MSMTQHRERAYSVLTCPPVPNNGRMVSLWRLLVAKSQHSTPAIESPEAVRTMRRSHRGDLDGSPRTCRLRSVPANASCAMSSACAQSPRGEQARPYACRRCRRTEIRAFRPFRSYVEIGPRKVARRHGRYSGRPCLERRPRHRGSCFPQHGLGAHEMRAARRPRRGTPGPGGSPCWYRSRSEHMRHTSDGTPPVARVRRPLRRPLTRTRRSARILSPQAPRA